MKIINIVQWSKENSDKLSLKALTQAVKVSQNTVKLEQSAQVEKKRRKA